MHISLCTYITIYPYSILLYAHIVIYTHTLYYHTVYNYMCISLYTHIQHTTIQCLDTLYTTCYIKGVRDRAANATHRNASHLTSHTTQQHTHTWGTTLQYGDTQQHTYTGYTTQGHIQLHTYNQHTHPSTT